MVPSVQTPQSMSSVVVHGSPKLLHHRFNIPSSGPLSPFLQLALDETPVQYAPTTGRTLQVFFFAWHVIVTILFLTQEPQEQGSGSAESKQVRACKQDRRMTTGCPVVNRAGQLVSFQVIWKGKSDRCHPRKPDGVIPEL